MRVHFNRLFRSRLVVGLTLWGLTLWGLTLWGLALSQSSQGAGSHANAFDDSSQLPTPTDGGRFFAEGSRPPFPDPYSKRTLVDLHSHIFAHGMGFLSSGNFHDPILSAAWQSRIGNKVNAEGLEASGLGLVVVALYAHPILSMPAKEGLRNQINMAEEFVRNHPDWVIVRNAEEGKKAYAQGKRIMVLSLEGASPNLEDERDIEEFIDQKKISIVTFSHMTSDDLSGAALMSGYQSLSDPLQYMDATFRAHGCYGEALSPSGLTPKGLVVVQALLKRGVWIDLAHASEETHRLLDPLLDHAGQPYLYTHTYLRKDHAAERALSDAQLLKVAQTGGIIGVVPGEAELGSTPVPKENCPARCRGQCHGGVFAMAAQFNTLARAIGPTHVFVGSDFNGAMDHLEPSRPCLLGSEIDRKGMANISQTGELWQDLGSAGAVSGENERDGVEHFLEVWARVKPTGSGQPAQN